MEETLKDIMENGRSFEEDSHMENGNYMNTCLSCGHRFLGHKRRRICKICITDKLILKDLYQETVLDDMKIKKISEHAEQHKK